MEREKRRKTLDRASRRQETEKEGEEQIHGGQSDKENYLHQRLQLDRIERAEGTAV